MKKIKLLIAAVAMVGLASSSIASADGFAPGEGLYIGGFASGETGLVQPKVTTNGTSGASPGNNVHEGGTWQVDDGGLGLEGVSGGGWLGYGYNMGGLYAGIEGEYVAGDVTFKVSGSAVSLDNYDGSDRTITSIEATKVWTGGMFGRLGFYVNPSTLLAFKGGVLVSKFDVDITGTNYSASESYYGGGPSFGVSLASAIVDIDPNLSVRVGAVYTDFLTASVFGIGSENGLNNTNRSGHDSEVTGSSLSARIGLAYSFFDVNSLF